MNFEGGEAEPIRGGIEALRGMGYAVIGLDGAATTGLEAGLAAHAGGPVALVLGAEGPGLRTLTRSLCDTLVRIPAQGPFAVFFVLDLDPFPLAGRSLEDGAGWRPCGFAPGDRRSLAGHRVPGR